MREMQEKMDKEKAEIQARANKDVQALLDQQNQTEEERQALREKLEKESKTRMDMENQRLALQNKLKAMEEKLMVGGEIANKAAKQEAELRQAEQELAERKNKELALARQMADQEEMNLELEEKFGSLQDEVDAKTKKLKKLWNKYQQSKNEVRDITEEFQAEKNDMLETIRDLSRQLKLKELIISNFVPPEDARNFDDVQNGGRAVWQEEEECWVIPR
jgi:kinesin family member 3B